MSNIFRCGIHDRTLPAVQGWQLYNHPIQVDETYCYRTPDCTSDRPAFTPDFLFSYKANVHDEAEACYKHINAMLQSFPQCPNDTQIVFSRRADAIYYYCASPRLRQVFWPEETDAAMHHFELSDIILYDCSELSTCLVGFIQVPIYCELTSYGRIIQ